MLGGKDRRREEWLNMMKASFSQQESMQDKVPSPIEDELVGMPPEVWNSIVSNRIKDVKQLKNHHPNDIRPVIEYLMGRPAEGTRQEDLVQARVDPNQRAQLEARFAALQGVMMAVNQDAHNQYPAQAAGMLRGYFKKHEGFKEKLKEVWDDLLDFVGNAIAVLTGF